MPGVECVSDQELQAFLLGQLPKRLAGTVADHLEVCPVCEASARRLDAQADPVIRSLRRSCRPGEQVTPAPDCLLGGLSTTSLSVWTGPPVAAAENADASLPRCIAGYEVLGELGRGGMGVVYKARQTHPDRLVALKMVLAGGHSDPAQRVRLLAEADAIARLRHPHIVQVYEVGLHEGLPFLSLEYVDGDSLARKLGGIPQPPRQGALLVETLARAIDHAHQHGVIHRDLKPANILVNADGTPKVTDFGLAKQERPELTATGAILGTPSYMAPEQAAGDNRAVGAATDVYALGAILYELLTGRPPFRGATPLDTLEQVRTQEAVAPSQLQPQLPADLSTICLKCLRKEPSRRYASALDLANDLRRFLDGQPVQARPVGVAERLWRWGRRNPGWAAALALLLLTAVGALVAAVNLAWSLNDSEQAHARTKEAERETLLKLYHATVNQARAQRLTGRAGQRHASLALLERACKLARELQLPTEEFNGLRNEVIACLALPDLELLKEWDNPQAAWCYIDFNEDMTLYASGDPHGQVTVRRIADNVEVGSVPARGEPVQCVFSPGGRYLAVCSERRTSRFQLWKVGGAAPAWERDPRAALLYSFQADQGGGERLVALHQDGTLTIHQVETGAEIQRCKLGPPTKDLAFHPSRPVVALCSGAEVLLFDLKIGAITGRLRHPARVYFAAWGAGGRLLVAGCDDVQVHLWQVDPNGKNRLAGTFSGNKTLGIQPKVNRDGTLLASTDWTNDLHLWDAQGGQQLLIPLAEGCCFRFGARADLLACTGPGGKLRLYRTIRSREFRRLNNYNPAAGPGWRRLAIFHPSGRLLLAHSKNGMTVWDTRTAEVLPQPARGWLIPIAFASGGDLVTEAAAGYQRWPVLADPTQPDQVRLGPARLLAVGPTRQRAACSADGRVLAIPAFGQGSRLVLGDEPAQEIRLGPQGDVRYCAVSPQGDWVATGSHDVVGKPGVLVWRARAGKQRPQELPILRGLCEVEFSPDGRWLITGGDSCRLWEVGSWRPGPVLGGRSFAFAPDSKLLAVNGAEGMVRLVLAATGKEYARLSAPGELHSDPCCFSPDGTQLVVSNSAGLYLWDLRSVRAHLQTLGLDWELPPYPPAQQSPPLRLELVER